MPCQLRFENVTRLPPEQRPVNTVFQSYALFPHLTIRENIAFGPKLARPAPAELRNEVGITFIYVTHDQGEAMSISDRIAVMNKGTVEQIGKPTEIYEAPRTSFVAAFPASSKTSSTSARTLDIGCDAANGGCAPKCSTALISSTKPHSNGAILCISTGTPRRIPPRTIPRGRRIPTHTAG